MPELPEVERARRLAAAALEGKVVKEARTTEDEIVFDGVDHAEFARRMTGKRIVKIGRKGKQLWFECDKAPHPTFHFGMTGSFAVKGGEVAYYKSFSVDTENWPPKFWKVELEMDDGTLFAFMNIRRLGRIRLLDDPLSHKSISELGFDPLTEMMPVSDFVSAIRRRHAPIKAVLLDQSLAAGVGNWIADEVLYQARVHPGTVGSVMTDEEITRVHDSLDNVIRTACDANADSDKFPQSWLFHYRWSVKDAGNAKDANNQTIKFEKVGGRTSAYVPAVQGAAGRKRTPKKGGKKKSAADAAEDDDELEDGEADNNQDPNEDEDRKSRGKNKRKQPSAAEVPLPSLHELANAIVAAGSDEAALAAVREMAQRVVDSAPKGSGAARPKAKRARKGKKEEDNGVGEGAAMGVGSGVDFSASVERAE
ncbi:unnamed protein product [Vitrella brassicaformis CCMP3155]|uniref:Formamidopyrimidine-DNA glycosylase catalytic domain-containing protein n=2 Tax=Vitrella brassicaformis TaxID=1169539 RepID=A0A0G4GD98_VITBC|nr:unnamed protein product [Vitrella brassicaformis CCMP3155]|eukprot:CEM27244.1 unnamed protein product [Vitrella brassicaformis CCMP3155]